MHMEPAAMVHRTTSSCVPQLHYSTIVPFRLLASAAEHPHCLMMLWLLLCAREYLISVFSWVCRYSQYSSARSLSTTWIVLDRLGFTPLFCGSLPRVLASEAYRNHFSSTPFNFLSSISHLVCNRPASSYERFSPTPTLRSLGVEDLDCLHRYIFNC
jgi:hypothetical protein